MMAIFQLKTLWKLDNGVAEFIKFSSFADFEISSLIEMCWSQGGVSRVWIHKYFRKGILIMGFVCCLHSGEIGYEFDLYGNWLEVGFEMLDSYFRMGFGNFMVGFDFMNVFN